MADTRSIERISCFSSDYRKNVKTQTETIVHIVLKIQVDRACFYGEKLENDSANVGVSNSILSTFSTQTSHNYVGINAIMYMVGQKSGPFLKVHKLSLIHI